MAQRNPLTHKNSSHYFSRLLLLISVLLTFIALFSISQTLQAQSCKLPDSAATDYDFAMAKDNFGPNPNATTDYYKMAVNWSEDYCTRLSITLASETDPTTLEKLHKDNAFQCFSDQQFGWVLHGLWASSCDGKGLGRCTDLKDIRKHPRFCGGDLPQLPYSEIEPYLCISPSAALLQAEWEKHGACDFTSATDYFEKSRQLFTALRYPPTTMSHQKLDRWMKKNNPQLANKRLLYRGSEMYICYNTAFELIDCPRIAN
ncbi:ribonuclease T2 family protein [Cellvibrio mixtus]|nr:ribonuclease [Cellvibrio mixtus]